MAAMKAVDDLTRKEAESVLEHLAKVIAAANVAYHQRTRRR
jgi:hypothetical protein